jgi:hypothetical protein
LEEGFFYSVLSQLIRTQDNVLIYAGLSFYEGGQRGLQDVGGGVLVHIRVRDLSTTPQAESIGSPAHTSVLT